MKFKIIAEDKKKRIVVIPLSAREIGALSDLGFMLEEGMWKLFKLNKIDKEMKSLVAKFHHLLFDVKDGGRTYCWKGKKFVLNKDPTWIVRKPRWRKWSTKLSGPPSG